MPTSVSGTNALLQYQSQLESQLTSGEVDISDYATQTSTPVYLTDNFDTDYSAFETALASLEVALSDYITMFENDYLDENYDSETLKTRMKDKIEKGYRNLWLPVL